MKRQGHIPSGDIPPEFEISEKKFAEMMVAVKASTASMVIGSKDLSPMLTVFYRKLIGGGMMSDIEMSLYVIGGDFIDDDRKEVAMRTCGQTVNEQKLFPLAVFMSSEAWLSKANGKHGPPSQDPEREEAIVVAGRNISGDHRLLSVMSISRDSEGVISSVDGFGNDTKPLGTQLLDKFFHGYFSKAMGVAPVKGMTVQEIFKSSDGDKSEPPINLSE